MAPKHSNLTLVWRINHADDPAWWKRGSFLIIGNNNINITNKVSQLWCNSPTGSSGRTREYLCLKASTKLRFFFPITSNNLGKYTVCLVFSLSLVILSISVHLSVIR